MNILCIKHKLQLFQIVFEFYLSVRVKLIALFYTRVVGLISFLITKIVAHYNQIRKKRNTVGAAS